MTGACVHMDHVGSVEVILQQELCNSILPSG